MEDILDKNFWDQKYISNDTGWDIGYASPPLVKIIDKIEDRSSRILIPGAGNAYEVEYMIEKGFSDITVIDISPTLIKRLQEKFFQKSGITLIEGDFFEHQQKYDYIIEQTFFCALMPSLRKEYVAKMDSLLSSKGVLAGVLFNRQFAGGPPFGGSIEEYHDIFNKTFEIVHLAECNDSIGPRQNSEVEFFLKKKIN
ncbi:MAG: methyltransferase domain-containing protein [Saprospiraceae bacterium]|nr:methyltransferase domain-containing protein [Saprospiraceae bacterium]